MHDLQCTLWINLICSSAAYDQYGNWDLIDIRTRKHCVWKTFFNGLLTGLVINWLFGLAYSSKTGVGKEIGNEKISKEFNYQLAAA